MKPSQTSSCCRAARRRRRWRRRSPSPGSPGKEGSSSPPASGSPGNGARPPSSGRESGKAGRSFSIGSEPGREGSPSSLGGKKSNKSSILKRSFVKSYLEDTNNQNPKKNPKFDKYRNSVLERPSHYNASVCINEGGAGDEQTPADQKAEQPPEQVNKEHESPHQIIIQEKLKISAEDGVYSGVWEIPESGILIVELSNAHSRFTGKTVKWSMDFE